MKTNRMFKKILSIYLIFTFIWAQAAYSLPQDVTVESGTADIAVDGSTMTITASASAILSYSSFNINSNESVIVILPSSASDILNRVTG
ncbi:MAG: hypothetical protein V1927_05210, partial [Candidatus Omnitrophota bacterium]